MPVNPPARHADTATGTFSASGTVSAPRQAQAEDELLAFLLIHTWTLLTGRVLRSDVAPAQLSEEELIAFWADDHIAPAFGGSGMS